MLDVEFVQPLLVTQLGYQSVVWILWTVRCFEKGLYLTQLDLNQLHVVVDSVQSSSLVKLIGNTSSLLAGDFLPQCK